MPTLLFYGAAALVGYLGFKAFVREADRVTEATRRAEAKQKAAETGRAEKTLVQDPKTGKYRVEDDV